MPAMEFALQSRFYAHVPVYLWPWVWWQIWQTMRWSDATGRAVAFSINQNGHLYVDFVADDPHAPKAWVPGELTAAIPGYRFFAVAIGQALAGHQGRLSGVPGLAVLLRHQMAGPLTGPALQDSS